MSSFLINGRGPIFAELTEKEKNELLKTLSTPLNNYMELKHEIKQTNENIENKKNFDNFVNAVYKKSKNENEINDLKNSIDNSKENLKKFEKLSLDGKKKIESGLEKIKNAEIKFENAEKKIENGLKKIEEAQKQQNLLIAKSFLSTFGLVFDEKNTLETIQQKYILPNGEPKGLYLDKKEKCCKISSFGPFIALSTDNADKKGCNFTKFGNIAADVDEFVLYILDKSCKVTGIGFHKSLEDRKILQNTETLSKVLGNLTLKDIFKNDKSELVLSDLQVLTKALTNRTIKVEFREATKL